ncbi:chlorite dismutase family protein [Pelagicoccus sp. SDUM812003]|uniref:chlorite dismutase family protein n=1 Tax=Pelagicoccus sp. SDUM812003 TaxID=3041267 RepID=UPI00281097A6|nr:chlorite dismutase family protein [Pelagicoccus sp. SDUM812003]MDQ8201828.1 chlorite dismutase family protein [Pelagicoccus sp. SDUM812003]
MNKRLFSFVAGECGEWSIRSIQTIVGESLPTSKRLTIENGDFSGKCDWALRGVTSNERYVTKAEKTALVSKQEGLGRKASNYAALIPIRKTDAWWSLTQEERRDIFEEQSRHTDIGQKFLPNIARKLHHCRDLASVEPFDFITWFEYSSEDETMFDELVQSLREGIEWQYVEREIDIRLVKE